MPTSTRTFFIGLGTPTVSSPSVTIFDSGQAGTLGAQRILTHPDNPTFAPITYYKNPTRTFNLDNTVLPSPTATAVKTLQGRQVIRFNGELEDVVVKEVWEADDAAMPTSLFRQLYEYLVNPPVFDALAQTYITWQPRDRNTLTYNVQLVRLTVGIGSGDDIFDVDDFRLATPPEISHALESLDVQPDGLITRDVTMTLRIVSEVV